MLSVSEIVAKTEAMFDLFDHHFYNDELTRPAITVSPDGGRGAYGWCSVKSRRIGCPSGTSARLRISAHSKYLQ